MCMFVCACMCVHACVCVRTCVVCVCVCMRACGCVCVRTCAEVSTHTVLSRLIQSHGDVFVSHGEWEGVAVVMPFTCNHAPVHLHDGSLIILCITIMYCV